MALSVRARGAGFPRPAIFAVLSLAAVSWLLSVGRMQGMDAGPAWRSAFGGRESRSSGWPEENGARRAPAGSRQDPGGAASPAAVSGLVIGQ